MKPEKLPALVLAHLRVAFKLPYHKRQGAVDRVLREAMLFFPKCFVETMKNEPLYRELNTFEKYIETLKLSNKETTK
jgi:hypothetical protein